MQFDVHYYYSGNVPAPLLMAGIFDSSCLLWQESCGQRGSCWIYDMDSLSNGITSLGREYLYSIFKSIKL